MKYLAATILSFLMISYAAEPAVAQTVAVYNKQKTSSITEKDLRDFSKMQTNLQNGPYQDYVDFINTRFADDIVSKDKTTTVFEGQPEEVPGGVKETTSSKQDVIKEAQAVYNLMKGAKINNVINDIKIASDKKTASVKDTTTFANTVSPDPSNTSVKANINILSVCDNQFRVSKDGILQLTKSICETVMNVKQ